MAFMKALPRVHKYLTPMLYQVTSSRLISLHHLTWARVDVRNRFQLWIPETISGFCLVRMYRLVWGLSDCLDSKHIPPALIFSATENFSAQFFVEKLENMMTVSEANRSSALFSFLFIILNVPSVLKLFYNKIENTIRLSVLISFFCRISLLFPVSVCLTLRPPTCFKSYQLIRAFLCIAAGDMTASSMSSH
jgi:hypothetical protein